MKKKLLLLVTVGLTSCPSGFSATPKTDRFGQPVDVEFVGKVRDEAELRADAAAEAKTLPQPGRSCSYFWSEVKCRDKRPPASEFAPLLL